MLLNFKNVVEKYNMSINGVLHIGAHYGQEHHLYESINIPNITYFEPLKKTFEVLKQNVGAKAILHNIALGNENKNIEMFVETVNRGMSSSILEPSLHLQQYPQIVFTDKENVVMKKLDDVIDNSNKEYNFINIDVQGYELEVFKGGVKTLENIDYIISEVNRAEVYKNCVHVDELSEFLEKFNFELVEVSWAGGTWGDALYVKKNN
jgi:FkbM family methyltransferase